MPSVPSKALRALALLALCCNVALGSNIPRYRYRLPPVKVDSRAFQVTSAPTRSVGRSRQLGASIPSSRLMGFTWYEYQHNGSTGRQIDEHDGYIEVSWMMALDPSEVFRTVDWWLTSVCAGAQPYLLANGDTVRFLELCPPAPRLWHPFTGQRPGFTNLRLRPSGAAVLIFHDAPYPSGPQSWQSELDMYAHQGFFNFDPSRAPNPPGPQYQEDAAIWPKQAISTCGSDLVHHAIGTWSGDSNEVWYWRGLIFEDGSNDSIAWDVSQPTLVHPQDVGITAIIEAHGEDVTIVVGNQVNSTNADVGYYRSTDCGLTWGPFVNISNYAPTDPEGFWIEADVAYDSDGNLHVIWNTAAANGQKSPCNLYHWDEASGETRLIADAPWPDFSCYDMLLWPCGSGTSNLAIAEPSISIKPAGIHGIAEELLFAVWIQYGPTDTDCATVDELGTLFGCVNGEIYMSVSSDDGLTWDRPQNISGTETPNCLPGDCLSEGWVSTAAEADSGVYIAYVEDLHAGVALFGRGAWTDNPFKVIAPETRLPRPSAVIAVLPTQWIELQADPVTGLPDTVQLQITSIGNADLNYQANVTGDQGGDAFVTVNGGSSYAGTIPAGGPPDELTIAFHTTGLPDPSEHNWRLEITSNDPDNDPGEGGTPIDVNLQVFAASVWHECKEDTLSTGLHRLQISSCLEMGGQGDLGTGFFNYNDQTEWLSSGSPLISRITAGSDSLVHLNAYMTPADRARIRNRSFRAQSELQVTRDSTISVADTHYIADVAWGSASTTDTTIGIDYEVIFPKSAGLQRGAVWKLTTSTLTESTIEDVSLGVLADLDVVDALQGGTVWSNAGAGSELWGWIGARAGDADTAFGFVPFNSWMALFYLSPTNACHLGDTAAAQVIGNSFYLHPWGTYHTDSLFRLMEVFGSLGAWGTNIHIDTGQAAGDVSVLMVNEYHVDLVPGEPVDWGFGIAVSDISEADLKATIAALRAAIVGSCCETMVQGDADYSGGVTSADVIWLVNYVFKGGPEPLPCLANGDVDCTGSITSADIIYLVHYVFKGGDPPCDVCNDSPMECP